MLRSPGRAVLAVALVLGVAVVVGCTSTTTCKHVAESCSNTDFCCVSEGLLCQPGERGSFCSKSCRCHGTGLCTPSSFEEGCPQGSVCLPDSSDGKGECIVLCNTEPCDVGQYRCEPSGDGGAVRCSAVDAAAPPMDMAATTD